MLRSFSNALQTRCHIFGISAEEIGVIYRWRSSYRFYQYRLIIWYRSGSQTNIPLADNVMTFFCPASLNMSLNEKGSWPSSFIRQSTWCFRELKTRGPSSDMVGNEVTLLFQSTRVGLACLHYVSGYDFRLIPFPLQSFQISGKTRFYNIYFLTYSVIATSISNRATLWKLRILPNYWIAFRIAYY